MSKLKGFANSVSTLSGADVERMYDLLSDNFTNVGKAPFLRDLSEKDWVISVRDHDLQIQGFSTLKFFQQDFGGRAHRIAFSGDTIVSPKYWGSLEMSVMIGRKIFEHFCDNPETPLWWLLISKGIRTYKCMPAFFNTFYPNPYAAAPAEVAGLMNQLGLSKFGRHYNPKNGVISPSTESYYLRPDLAEPDRRRASDDLSRFFYAKNPEYHRGAELLCLGQFHPVNLRPLIRRLILQKSLIQSTGQRLYAA
jgi:hypothetical protein